MGCGSSTAVVIMNLDGNEDNLRAKLFDLAGIVSLGAFISLRRRNFNFVDDIRENPLAILHCSVYKRADSQHVSFFRALFLNFTLAVAMCRATSV